MLRLSWSLTSVANPSSLGTTITFTDNVADAVQLAHEVAGDRDVALMGGPNVARQALDAGSSTPSNCNSSLFCSVPARRCSRPRPTRRTRRGPRRPRAPSMTAAI